MPKTEIYPQLRESLVHGVFRTRDDRFYAGESRHNDNPQRAFCLQYLLPEEWPNDLKIYLPDLDAAQAMVPVIRWAEETGRA